MSNEEDNKENFYKNLVILFKLFKNSPNHLSKYLIKNSAFTEDFMMSIINSKKLDELRPQNEEDYFSSTLLPNPISFTDIQEMEEYYDSILEEINITEDKQEMENQLNSKLSRLIKKEKYEDAARLRDYMSNNDFNIYK